MQSPNTWFSLYPSGKRFDIYKPRVEDIEIEDIARSLSMKCRFNGFVNNFYSVAEHCCIMFDIVWNQESVEYHFARSVLMHDAAEAYLTDIPAPVKTAIPQFKETEEKIMACIRKKFMFSAEDLSVSQVAALHQLDMDICVTEALWLGLNINEWEEYQNGHAKLITNQPIYNWVPKTAELNFLDRFNKVFI